MPHSWDLTVKSDGDTDDAWESWYYNIVLENRGVGSRRKAGDTFQQTFKKLPTEPRSTAVPRAAKSSSEPCPNACCWLHKDHDGPCEFIIWFPEHCDIGKGQNVLHKKLITSGQVLLSQQEALSVPHSDSHSETSKLEVLTRKALNKGGTEKTDMTSLVPECIITGSVPTTNQRYDQSRKKCEMYLAAKSTRGVKYPRIPPICFDTLSEGRNWLSRQSLSPPCREKHATIRQAMRDSTLNVAKKYQGSSGSDVPSYYSRLDLEGQEIRLFKLSPAVPGLPLHGSFISCPILECPAYIALSYTWGDGMPIDNVNLNNGGKIPVRDSLYQFLRLQATYVSEATHFWIDAICINQKDIWERNHQVGMMKAIYEHATEVYVWLGLGADDSDHVMKFMAYQSAMPLREKGFGYLPMWSCRTAKGLSVLFERPYWRRMWIIQELLHARRITVWCGEKKFDWSAIEALYFKMETIAKSSWFAHHKSLLAIRHSAAATMVWQRAHWRHPDTPAPTLSQLIETFREWHCTDIRDKVFALVGMVPLESAIVPDYALTPTEIYHAVMTKVKKDRATFATSLRWVLGVTWDRGSWYVGPH